MTMPPAAAPASLPGLTGVPPQRGWTWWLGLAITLTVLFSALFQLRDLDPAGLRAMVPVDPRFWMVFMLSYLCGPIGDFLIFRQLWNIPADGFLALIRKMISNELVAGYVGDASFYTWARQRMGMVAAPFGAIKDVAILSAMASNIITLLLLALAFPLLHELDLDLRANAMLLSGGAVLLLSLLVLRFRRAMFSLPLVRLRPVLAIQCLRVLAYVLLIGTAWHLALPNESLQLWLVLSALAMLLSRLPFVPNPGLVFAGLAAFLIGHDAQVTRLMAMMAGLTLTTHLLVGLPLLARELLPWRS